MPTVYKWYPGHYVLGAGTTRTLTTLLDGIAGTGTNNIKNLVGVQIRYIWKQLESNTVPGQYDFSSILSDLQTLKTYSASSGRHLSLRILLQFKGIGGRGAPTYLRPGQTGYRSEFGIGTYTWGNAENEDSINEHPALWIPAVEERLALFMEAMGTALDSIGRPAGDIRYHLSTVDFNETSWGKNGDTALTTSQQTDQKDALLRIQNRTKAKFPTTLVGHFVNFPPFAVNAMVGPMRDNGITLGGPDTWWDDPSVENGVYQQYEDAWGVTAISPSIQNQNWEYKKHADVNPPGTAPPIYYIGHLYDGAGNPSLVNFFNRVTTGTVVVDGQTRQGLRGTHVTWQGATWALHNSDGTLSSLKPWNLIRDYFRKIWDEGPFAGNTTPGIDAATIPSRLLTGAPPPPPPPPTGSLALVLTTDTGAVNNDKVTSNAAVDITGTTSGATKQYSTSATGPWSTSAPTPVIGSNTWYGRQVVSGSPSAATAALTFTFCNTAPVLAQATVNGNVLLLEYDSPVPLTNATGFKPLGPQFAVRSGGTTVVPVSGTFVNEDIRRVRVDLGSSVAVGAVITVSYTQPTSGTARIQDLAGNYAANLVNQAVTNLTGVTAPTTTVTVTSAGGVATGGAMNDATPTIVGTLSTGLTGLEQLEVQRAPSGGAFVAIGSPTVTGTNWTITEPAPLADGAYQYRGRVRNGDLVGSFSSTITVTLDSVPPDAPTVSGSTVAWNEPPILAGSWSALPGETLSVTVGATGYTTANGLVISGTSWTLALPVMPPGVYAISARTTDAAGNSALDESPAQLTVTTRPSINHARLAKAKRW